MSLYEYVCECVVCMHTCVKVLKEELPFKNTGCIDLIIHVHLFPWGICPNVQDMKFL